MATGRALAEEGFDLIEASIQAQCRTDPEDLEGALGGHVSSQVGAGHGHEGFRVGEEPRDGSLSPRREQFIKVAFAGCATNVRILLAMLTPSSYQGIRSAPIPSGWVQTGDRWALWYNGRETASVVPDGRPGLRLWMEGQKFWQVKDVRVANVRQGKRFAERWCAARLYPGVPLREAVARLTDNTPIQPAPPLPGLPPTREQMRQAQRLDEASAVAAARVKAALAPRPAPVVTKPRAKDPMKAWVRAGRSQLPRAHV